MIMCSQLILFFIIQKIPKHFNSPVGALIFVVQKMFENMLM